MLNSYTTEKFKVSLERHPCPYLLQWMNESGEARASMQVSITMRIDDFEMAISCDVVPITACDLLLECPWQYDHDLQWPN